MSDIIRLLCITGIVVVVGVPVLWAALHRLSTYEPPPRQRVHHSVPNTVTTIPRPRRATTNRPIYDWAQSDKELT